VWRDPRALRFRGGDCEAAGVRSGFCDSTLSDGVWRCSSATAIGPALQWLLGMVSSASLFSPSVRGYIFMATTCVVRWLVTMAWYLSVCVTCSSALSG
jgi:hypothetical protein